MKILRFSLLCAALCLLAGCHAPKNVTYMEGVETIPAEVLATAQTITDPVIVPGDLLNIEVSSANPTAVAPFNKGQYVTQDGNISSTGSNSALNNNYSASTQYYLVNADGYIDFPILGSIKAGGMTKTQLANELRQQIYPRYVKQEPTIEVRLMNFKVTVYGAVRNPGVYQSNNERLNLLEALAMAGDLDIKGERESIMLLRTNAKGQMEVHRLNLNDKNVLLSPYFNLQQNDAIYVTPNKYARQNAFQMNPALQATLTIIGSVSSMAGLAISIVNLCK